MTTLTITSFTPSSGEAGTKVTIIGSGFFGVTNVLFNDTPASFFRANTDEKLIAKPAQGTTTGYITVETADSSAISSTEFTISDAPTLSSFTPTSAYIGDSLTLNGTNLSETSEVEFGTNAAVSKPTSTSDAQVKVSVPDSAITGQITVVTPGGKATTTDSFSLKEKEAPTISDFSPTEGPPNTAVSLTGKYLGGTTEILFGGVSATYFILSATSVTAFVPNNAISGVISVSNSAGTGTSESDFSVTPAPEITKIAPTSGEMGTSVTLTGSNFVNVSEVTFGSDYATATFDVVSNSQIQTSVPSGAVTGKISVTADAGTATSSTEFTVESSAAPTIKSFSPTQGDYGTPVTITGSNFTGVTGATLGDTKVKVLKVVSDSQMVITVPLHSSSGKIAVTNTKGTATSSDEFQIIGMPTINGNGFTPTSGAAETTVTIKGTNFTKDSVVIFHLTQSTSVTFVSDSEIKATVPTGSTSGKITVTTSGGSAISSDTFTVESSGVPKINGFSPSSGGAYDLIELTGSNFTGTTAVKFNGTDAARFIVTSDQQLSAQPSTDTTSGPITVTNTKGSGTSSNDFTFIDQPTLTDFSPKSGQKGVEVTLTGTNFTPSASVHFNALAAEVSFSSETQIKATVPDGATTGAIIVQTEGGVAKSEDSFSVESSGAPTITGFTPDSAAVAELIKVGGTNFTGVEEVYFYNGVSALFSVSSDTLLTATTPKGATTGPITIQNTVDKVTSTDSLEILQAPSISGFTPGSGSPGTPVTIKGENFVNVLYVTFQNTKADFTIDDGQILATVPENAQSGPIRVVTRAGQALSDNDFNVTQINFTPSTMSTNSTANSCPDPATQGWDQLLTVTQSVLASGIITLYNNDKIPHEIQAAGLTYDIDCPTLTIDTTDSNTINIEFPVSQGTNSGTVTLTLDVSYIAIETIIQLYYANLPGNVSSYVDCGDLNTTFSSDTGFTFEAWVQKKDSDSQTIFSIGDNLSLNAEIVSVTVNNEPANGTKLALTWGTTFTKQDNYTDLSDGRWHHVAVIVNSESISFYIDGRAIGTFQLDDSQTASGDLKLGSSFNGYITQVAVWKMALSESNLQQWMNATLSSSEENLVGYWTFSALENSTNIISGKTITLEGNATIEKAKTEKVEINGKEVIKLPYQMFLYVFDTSKFVTVTVDGFGSAKNAAITKAAQAFIDTYIDSAYLVGSGFSDNTAIFPSLAKFMTLNSDLSDKDCNQLLLPMMIANDLPPSDYDFGNAPLTLPSGSNAKVDLWDYAVLKDLIAPNLATRLDVDESAFTIAYNNCLPILSLNRNVEYDNATIKTLDVEIVAPNGVKIATNGVASGLYNFTIQTTVAVTVDADTQTLLTNPESTSSSISANAGAWSIFVAGGIWLSVTLGIIGLIIAVLLILFATIGVSIIFNQRVKNFLKGLTTSRELSIKGGFELEQISFENSNNALEFSGHFPVMGATQKSGINLTQLRKGIKEQWPSHDPDLSPRERDLGGGNLVRG